MQKSFGLFIIASLLLSILPATFVFAEENSASLSVSARVNSGDDTEARAEARGDVKTEIRRMIAAEIDSKIAELRLRLMENNGTIEIGHRMVRIRGLDDADREIIVNGTIARTRLNLSAEKVDGETRLRAVLSNGEFAMVRIMPDVAATIALEKIRARCDMSNCSVELKQKGEGDRTKAVYVINADKEARFLFLFKTRMDVESEVDAETGEVIVIRKPWWSFLAAESDTSVESSIGIDSDSEIDAEVNSSVNVSVEAEN